MRPAAEKLAAALAKTEIKAPAIPVLHNADVAAYADPAAIRDALARQLYMPVRWVETVQAMGREGVQIIAECGPGKVLAGLNKRILENVPTLPITDAATLEDVLAKSRGS
jgi:[acyl-carrier-protein] S-malonyltransferase